MSTLEAINPDPALHAASATQQATSGPGVGLRIASANTTAPAVLVRGAGDLLDLRDANGVSRLLVSQAGAVSGVGALAPTGDLTVTAGDIIAATAGKGVKVKEGTNAKLGTGTLNGVNEVTVSTTAVTANSRIFLSIQAPAGTPGGAIYVSSRVAGTSFGVKGAASDTSTFAWMIIEPA